MDLQGKAMTSFMFANQLKQWMVQGISHIYFVIGGSLGLDDAVIQRANCKVSLSAFTFPHQIVKVLVLEQIYRGYKIIRGETYHK